MAKRSVRIPKYQRHGTGQAKVRLGGHDFYLGKFGTSESRERYRRLISEWTALGCPRPWSGPAKGSGRADTLAVDEVILAYPGVLAVTVYRLAHELYLADVPLMPRIMTEWAHTITGVDIHPGAAIGRSFFVDHATGVVIGETTHIGNNVKLYQGVTLGALSFPKDERGRVIRGRKRHPTLDDGVTIYANATVLGGNTTIGKESILGASVFVTRAVPAQHAVAHRAPELKVKPTTPDAIANAAEPPNDFQV